MEGIIQYDKGSQNHYKWIKVKKKSWNEYKIFFKEKFCIRSMIHFLFTTSQVLKFKAWFFFFKLILHVAVNKWEETYFCHLIVSLKFTGPSLLIHEYSVFIILAEKAAWLEFTINLLEVNNL